MGDLSVNIAHSAGALIDVPSGTPVVDIPLLAGLVGSMVRKSMDAFVARDVELARDVLASDDAVDDLRTDSYHCAEVGSFSYLMFHRSQEHMSWTSELKRCY